MADNRRKEYVMVRGHAIQELSGYFTSSGSTTVLTTVKGTGFSVTRSATGIFTLCLSSTFPNLVGLVVSQPMSNTVIGSPFLVNSSTVSGTNTITITVVANTTSGAVATDLTSGLGISFRGLFYNSSLTT